MKKRNIALTINMAIIIMEIVGIIMSIMKHGVSFVRFYTEDSNIFALAASIIYVVSDIAERKGGSGLQTITKIVRYISACCLSVTFVVVLCILAPMNGVNGYITMMFCGSMLFHHFLCPVLSVISFLFFEKYDEIPLKYTYYALCPTFIYAVTAVVLNIVNLLKGPYPFLMVHKQPVYMSCVWFVVILAGAYIFAWLIRKIKHII